MPERCEYLKARFTEGLVPGDVLSFLCELCPREHLLMVQKKKKKKICWDWLRFLQKYLRFKNVLHEREYVIFVAMAYNYRIFS